MLGGRSARSLEERQVGGARDGTASATDVAIDNPVQTAYAADNAALAANPTRVPSGLERRLEGRVSCIALLEELLAVPDDPSLSCGISGEAEDERDDSALPA